MACRGSGVRVPSGPRKTLGSPGVFVFRRSTVSSPLTTYSRFRRVLTISDDKQQEPTRTLKPGCRACSEHDDTLGHRHETSHRAEPRRPPRRAHHQGALDLGADPRQHQWNFTEIGPRPMKFGTHLPYSRTEIREWMDRLDQTADGTFVGRVSCPPSSQRHTPPQFRAA